MRRSPPTRATRVDPGTVGALTSLASDDHADRAVLQGLAATPGQWARAVFGDVPSPAGQLSWRGVLGFGLSRGRSADTVGGWRIGGGGSDWIQLENASHLGADMLVQTGGGAVAWTTCRRFERLPGRVVWAPASAVHRRLVPAVLRSAAARLDAPGAAP